MFRLVASSYSPFKHLDQTSQTELLSTGHPGPEAVNAARLIVSGGMSEGFHRNGGKGFYLRTFNCVANSPWTHHHAFFFLISQEFSWVSPSVRRTVFHPRPWRRGVGVSLNAPCVFPKERGRLKTWERLNRDAISSTWWRLCSDRTVRSRTSPMLDPTRSQNSNKPVHRTRPYERLVYPILSAILYFTVNHTIL